MDDPHQRKLDNITYVYSKEESEKRNTFRGIATHISNTSDVRLAYKRVKQLFPESDHIMMAYVLKDHSGWQDDSNQGQVKRFTR